MQVVGTGVGFPNSCMPMMCMRVCACLYVHLFLDCLQSVAY
jgi:hypothetical protein